MENIIKVYCVYCKTTFTIDRINEGDNIYCPLCRILVIKDYSNEVKGSSINENY